MVRPAATAPFNGESFDLEAGKHLPSRGVAIRIEVPWDRANVSHEQRIDLLDEDGHPLMIDERPLVGRGTSKPGDRSVCVPARRSVFLWRSTSQRSRSHPARATPGNSPSTALRTQTGVKASLSASESKPALPTRHPQTASGGLDGPVAAIRS